MRSQDLRGRFERTVGMRRLPHRPARGCERGRDTGEPGGRAQLREHRPLEHAWCQCSSPRRRLAQRRSRVHACPGVPASRCSQVRSVASTTRWRDCVECLPHRTLAAMPRNGIAIQITIAVEHPVRAVHTFAWPPQVKGAQASAGFGSAWPDRRLPSLEPYRQARNQLFVWFGRRPTVRQLAERTPKFGTRASGDIRRVILSSRRLPPPSTSRNRVHQCRNLSRRPPTRAAPCGQIRRAA